MPVWSSHSMASRLLRLVAEYRVFLKFLSFVFVFLLEGVRKMPGQQVVQFEARVVIQ